jgi:DNA-binding PadR family transcriptional regulator
MGGEHHKNRYQLTTKGRKVSAAILAASSADTEQLMDMAHEKLVKKTRKLRIVLQRRKKSKNFVLSWLKTE